jgi:hypothetical protein
MEPFSWAINNAGALEVFTKEKTPQEWAITQVNFGPAYGLLQTGDTQLQVCAKRRPRSKQGRHYFLTAAIQGSTNSGDGALKNGSKTLKHQLQSATIADPTTHTENQNAVSKTRRRKSHGGSEFRSAWHAKTPTRPGSG